MINSTSLNEVHYNELCLSLKKKAKEALQVQATKEAAMEVDTEVPASQQQLRDVVQREAAKVADKRINALKQELATIKNLVLAKNTGRGQSSKGASTKRKKQDGKRPNDQIGTHGIVVPTHRIEDSNSRTTTSGNNNS
jgi:mannitol-specific phosphotransferase system IIBC component